MSSPQDVHTLLRELQTTLQQNNLWSTLPPSEEAMASTAPFCCDLMPFENWLQWLFIPRMQAILDARVTLPNECAIQPMAEVAFKDYRQDTRALTALIGRLDQSINQLNY
ncbi:YqcC family protein [Pokkaliibacter sp. CJK22405]|uniref:YqcC family protein n=1 Tax=Pokkaliibacter sp. CJK22405 TaxID=3384615 RepID=UPI0039850F8C